MPGKVSALMSQHRGPLTLIKRGKRCAGDDNGRTAPGNAVGSRPRLVDDDNIRALDTAADQPHVVCMLIGTSAHTAKRGNDTHRADDTDRSRDQHCNHDDS